MKTILIVEDSPTEMRLIQKALEGKGFRLLTAEEGEEAVRKAESERPDLILLDIILPKKNGFQVCRHLKSSEETKTIPIVLLTSKSQESDRFWGLKQGADEYLTKPFEKDQLLGSVQRFLGR